MTLQEATNIVRENGAGRYLLTLPDGTKVRKRYFHREGYGLCEYNRGSSRTGHRVYPFEGSIAAIPDTPVNERWERGWTRVAKLLRQSGFWPDVLASIEKALAIGYTRLHQARDARSAVPRNDGRSYEEHERDACAAMDAIVPDLSSDTEILYHLMSPPKLKAMWFGKYGKHILDNLAKHIREGIPTRVAARAGYDVSASYCPANKDENNNTVSCPYPRLWYSEEFRGCGNGHYYLGVSPTQAIHWEDD